MSKNVTNPYLLRLRERYASIGSSIEDLQNRAVTEQRDLSEDELRSIEGQTEAGKKLHAEIVLLTEQETRSAAVAELGANLRASAEKAESTTKANDRDPGHYRSVKEGGKNSFFADLYNSRSGNDDAAGRLSEHMRHMRAQTTTDIAGVVPPKWLADLYTSIAQQDAALASAITSYPIMDARPFSLPGQTASTAVVNQPSGENGALVDGDNYDAAAATITPSTIVGQETVSRQLLDASSPAIDQLILADLTASYNAERELRIGVALRAIGTALTTDVTSFNNPDAATFGYDLAVDAAMAVRKAMFRRPTFYAMDYDMFAAYLKLKDADGRPIVVASNAGPNNAGGLASVMLDGWIASVPVVVSQGMEPPSPDAEDMAAAMVHGPSVVYFESPQLTFRYEEVLGPQSIKLGLWRYFAVAVRQGTRAVKNVLVTPDESS